MGRGAGRRRHQLARSATSTSTAPSPATRSRHERRDGHQTRAAAWPPRGAWWWSTRRATAASTPPTTRWARRPTARACISVGRRGSASATARLLQLGRAHRGRPHQARRGRAGRPRRRWRPARRQLYGLASGTSFSCPLTAGVVALAAPGPSRLHAGAVVLAVLRDSASQAARRTTFSAGASSTPCRGGSCR